MLHAHFHASIHVALPQTFLSNLFLSSTWAASQAICYAHEAIYILKLWPFAFSTVSDHAHHLRVHWLGKFSFFMVFEIHSWPMVKTDGLWCSHHIFLTCTHILSQPIHKPSLRFFFLFWLAVQNFPPFLPAHTEPPCWVMGVRYWGDHGDIGI